MPNGSTLITALQPVRPGDLIEADFLNKLIAAVQDLEKRIGEPREPTGEGERHPFVIDELVFSGEEDAAFKVRGAGLKPAGLKAFYLNGYTIEASARGNDNAITVRLEMSGHAGVNASLIFRELESRTGVPQLLILTMQNEAGETASGATKMR